LSTIGKTVSEIVGRVDYPVTLALVDNQYTGLNDVVPEWADIKLLDLTHPEGRRTYERTITFLLSYVAYKKGATIKIEHSYGDALYGEIESGELNLVQAKREIEELVNQNIEIEKKMLTKHEAIYYLQKENKEDDLKIIQYLSRDFIPLYRIEDYICYFAGPLLPGTGYLKLFDIVRMGDGFLIILPDRKNPSQLGKIEERQKLLKTYSESKKWAEILDIWSIGHLNDSVVSGKISEIVKVAESFHEKKIAYISDEILHRKGTVRIVLIAGPSSSGKTTFSKRLSVHMKVNGLKPKAFGLDDYFVDRDKTPLDEEGNPYFDSIDAIDLKLFNEHLSRLLSGEEVEIPRFNFKNGKREWIGRKMRLKPDEILIIEGLHALNPRLTESVDDAYKYKIYVSALTQLNINRLNRIPTRDVRLLRRIFRDTLFRGNPPSVTLERWGSVVRGEEENIFPFQESADVMFNSSLVYELAVLKNFVETPLRSITADDPYYCEALRLLNFLNHFLPITEEEIPPTSILREFIGGSSFRY